MNTLLTKEDVKLLIDEHFHDGMHKEIYEPRTVKASSLLTHNRLDLGFKLLYLEMLPYGAEFSKDIYKEHIRAFSLGKYAEPGNDEKNNFDSYIDEFSAIFNSIDSEGFDPGRSLIPISRGGSIANGSHRVASAIILDKEISCVDIDTIADNYDYNFFYQRKVSTSILDVAVTKFIEYAKNVHIAFIWPIAVGHDKELELAIPNIVYRKDVLLDQNGIHNLLSQIYYDEEWLGSAEDDFRGSKGKLVEVYKALSPVRLIAFQSDSLEEVLKIKDKVRSIFDIGKHSIHITDTSEEAIRTARVVFNDNSIHFLNYSRPNKYLAVHKKINRIKEFVKKNALSNDEILVDSSTILELYGLRAANDIDYLVRDNSLISHHFKDISSHDEELLHYGESKSEMIYDPQFYFYFNDIKFVSFNMLYKMKKSRAEVKDINDVNMMSAMIEGNRTKELINKIKQIINYEKIKIRKWLIKFLKMTGGYDYFRKQYLKLKK